MADTFSFPFPVIVLSSSFICIFTSGGEHIYRSAGCANPPGDKLKVTHRLPHKHKQKHERQQTSAVNTHIVGLELAGFNVWVDSLTFHGHYLSLHTSGEYTLSHTHRAEWVGLTHNLSGYEIEMTQRWEAELRTTVMYF